MFITFYTLRWLVMSLCISNTVMGKMVQRGKEYTHTEDENILVKLLGSLGKDILLWEELDTVKRHDPEIHMNSTEIIVARGYPCEDHYVTTKDGYILNLQRIPHGLSGRGDSFSEKPVVLIQHGLASSSFDFLANLANESLPYILANAGADVWLGNSRGNVYSSNHKTLDTESLEFWNWTFDEMARYDLPAMLQYILATTRQKRLFYFGHSQGSTMVLIECSRNPELCPLIQHFYALAPASRLRNTTSSLRKFKTMEKQIGDLFNAMYNGSTQPISTFGEPNKYLLQLCRIIGKKKCREVLFSAFGDDPAAFNVSQLHVYVAHFPQPTSVKNLQHWLQSMNSGKFQNFDYESDEENMKKYGQATPPEYDLSNFRVPTTVVYGGNDILTSHPDMVWLLKHIKTEHDIYVPDFAHMDFVWGQDAALLYKHLVNDIFKKCSAQ